MFFVVYNSNNKPSFESTYEELKHLFFFFTICDSKVLSLPMRNWNPGHTTVLMKKAESFESTYEELKQCRYVRIKQFDFRFESTYEELKPAIPHAKPLDSLRFESTYEELKPCLKPFCLVWRVFWVYLWGIETTSCKGTRKAPRLRFESTYEELKLGTGAVNHDPFWVLSLPMRNWNQSVLLLPAHMFPSFESTYEELKLILLLSIHKLYCCFESTYEELKPVIRIFIIVFVKPFWVYLWGIETT